MLLAVIVHDVACNAFVKSEWLMYALEVAVHDMRPLASDVTLYVIPLGSKIVVLLAWKYR